jgi:Tfp pilus assembly protein PilX
VMMLVIFSLFVVMLLAGMRLISLQFRQAVDQEQRNQAFQVAEAGVQYSVWLLNEAEVPYGSLTPITDHEVQDPGSGEVIGTFTVEYTTDTSNGPVIVTATSTGQDALRSDFRETVVARLRREASGKFSLLTWHHLP